MVPGSKFSWWHRNTDQLFSSPGSSSSIPKLIVIGSQITRKHPERFAPWSSQQAQRARIHLSDTKVIPGFERARASKKGPEHTPAPGVLAGSPFSGPVWEGGQDSQGTTQSPGPAASSSPWGSRTIPERPEHSWGLPTAPAHTDLPTLQEIPARPSSCLQDTGL